VYNVLVTPAPGEKSRMGNVLGSEMRAREWDWLITDSALPEGTPKKLSRYAAVLGGNPGLVGILREGDGRAWGRRMIP
jgi:hypothetical protein